MRTSLALSISNIMLIARGCTKRKLDEVRQQFGLWGKDGTDTSNFDLPNVCLWPTPDV